MVCDYKALKMLVVDVVEKLDHAMALNSNDPQLEGLMAIGDRVILFEDCDPTTEVLARWIYEQLFKDVLHHFRVENRETGDRKSVV